MRSQGLGIKIWISVVLGCLVYFSEAVVNKSAPPFDDLRRSVLLSYAAYCPFADLRSWTCYWCEQPGMPKLSDVNTAYFGGQDVFSFVGIDRTRKSIELRFRGTCALSIKDWIADFHADHEVLWSDQPNVKIHKGFAESWKNVKPYVTQALNNVLGLCPYCSINVGGHSLGAALATLAAADIVRSGLKVATLSTQGSPRLGNSDFYDYYSSLKIPSYRLVNDDDLVPHVPSPHLDYHHIAREIWNTKNGTFVLCDNSGEDPHCSNSLHIPLQWSIEAHNYYLGIASHAGRVKGCNGPDNKGPTGTFNATR